MPSARIPIVNTESPRRNAARGVVLLLVLVVVAMLALGGYSFARMMMAEARAARHHALHIQSRAAAYSGVDYVMAMLADRRLRTTHDAELWDNPPRFRDVLVSGDPGSRNDPAFRFSVVAPRDDARGSSRFAIRYGISDESARLNLNSWPWVLHLLRDPETRRPLYDHNPLLSLPRMTPEIADAILDWIDPDDQPRSRGAESDYYLSLQPAYRARNAPLQSIQELLMVRGVTPRLLYGEDANQNGMLDPNENDGRRSYPDDDADGFLDRGWLSFITLHSRSSGTDQRGRAKIVLNSRDLRTLYQQLANDPEIGEEMARFVIAYRMFGPIRRDQDDSGTEENREDSKAGPQDRGQGDEDSSRQNVDEKGSRQPGEMVAGIDTSGGPSFDIASTIDVVDVLVSATVNGERRELSSPLNTKTAGLGLNPRLDHWLDHWLDRTATISESERPGRINVNTAAREVLMAVPSMTEDMVIAILASRGRRRIANDPFDAGLAWLLTDSVLTIEQFKRLEPYLTGYSQVYRMQVLGYSQDGRAVTRLRSIVDHSGPSPVVVSNRDLSSLGNGYDVRSQIGR